jgi:hypothetical protein
MAKASMAWPEGKEWTWCGASLKNLPFSSSMGRARCVTSLRTITQSPASAKAWADRLVASSSLAFPDQRAESQPRPRPSTSTGELPRLVNVLAQRLAFSPPVWSMERSRRRSIPPVWEFAASSVVTKSPDPRPGVVSCRGNHSVTSIG